MKAEEITQARKSGSFDAVSTAHTRELTDLAKVERRTTPAFEDLSLAQQGIWFVDQLGLGRAAAPVYQAVRLTGPLDVERLQQALGFLVRRHALLRTNFRTHEGRTVALVWPDRTIPLERPAFAPAEMSDAGLAATLAREIDRSFDLGEDSLLRAVLLARAETQHVLLLVAHPIIADAQSLACLWRELADFYRAGPAELPEPPARYADHVAWESELPAGKRGEELLGFWRRELAGGLPVLDLPYDFSRDKTAVARAGVERLMLPAALSAEFKQLVRKEGADLFSGLLAAYQLILHRWTHQGEIAVGSIVPGRRPGFERTVGPLANTLVFRTTQAGNPSFRDFLRNVHDVVQRGRAHQDLPFDRLARELRPGSAETSSLLQAFFVLQENALPAGLGDVALSAFELVPETTKAELTLLAADTPEGIRLELEYDATLFAPATAARILRSVEKAIEGAVTLPAQGVDAVPVVPAADLKRMLVEWNDTAVPYEKQLCVHEAFERQVAKTPDAIAVVGDNERWTYARLNDAAERLAEALRDRGVGPEVFTGVFLNRTPQLLVGILGVLKAGGAYVPLDPAYPKERLRFIVEDARMAVLVTEKGLAGEVDAPGVEKLLIESLPATASQASEKKERKKPDAKNLAYVIYTSGSTGKPKGVCVKHQGVMALVAWAVGLYTGQDLAGVLFATSACFDVSVFESLVPLCLGGKIVVARNILEVDTLPARNEVTLVSGVPSAMAEVVRTRSLPPSVRTVNVAGEPCPQVLIDDLYALGHIENVYDVYGPTETTVYSIGGKRVAGGRPTIGRPMPNERAYVLDANLQLVPPGVRGELFIGGEKLARGYLNRPDLTAEKFLEVRCLPGEPLYRTGDLVRWREDGTLEYLGRMDRQVKIRGFRIEPGEVEAVLRQHPAVKECAVVPRDDGAGAKILVGYVVANAAKPDLEEMRRFLDQRLPEYLVPTSFVALDSLPRSPNGKLDAKALPAPGAPAARPREYLPPRDGVEQQLVRLWEEVLNVRPIGIRDRFFDLGGHSLMAVRMLGQVEKKFGRKLPLSILFRAPTVEKLARTLRDEKLIAAGSSLVEIQPKGTKPPIFWLHTLGGGRGAGLFRYEKLARLLGPDQPSYGLVAPEDKDLPTFEEMAAYYIRELRVVQPTGPYYLGGYCFGGMLAYEVARQLAESGERIGMVIVLDGEPPNPPRLPGRASFAFCEHLAMTLPLWMYAAVSDPLDLFVRARLAANRGVRRALRIFTPGAASRSKAATAVGQYINMDSYPAEFRALAESHWEAMTSYKPRPFQGKLAVIRTHRPRLLKFPAEFLWSLLVPEVEATIVPGTHEDLLQEPQANHVAAAINRMLARVRK